MWRRRIACATLSPGGSFGILSRLAGSPAAQQPLWYGRAPLGCRNVNVAATQVYSRRSVATACASPERPSPTGPTFSAVLNLTETRSDVEP